MYLPKHFEQTDTEELYNTIALAPFGILVTSGAAGISADHLPFELDRSKGRHGSLYCHVARANTVWQKAASSSHDSLVIFQGPSTYISPSLYETKKETHKVVPTYNYAAVHVYGRMVVHDDARWVRGLVGRLTRNFEKQRETPWKMDDAPHDYIDERLTHIVGLEIEISRLEGKWKMSQNRTEADRESVVSGLLASADGNAQAVATVMQQLQASANKK